MPTSSLPPPAPVMVASFFKRLEAIDFITRVITSNARITAQFTFRGEPETKVLIDFTQTPGRVFLDEDDRKGQIAVTINGDIMHEVLMGRKAPGVAVARREMLLRGSPMNFAKFIPMFDFGPTLYKEHLADLGYKGFARHPGESQTKEIVMDNTPFKGDPIPLVKLSPLEKIVFTVMNGFSYAMGYMVGLMRYRLFKNLNLFSVLSFMSRGLAAAAPREETDGAGSNT